MPEWSYAAIADFFLLELTAPFRTFTPVARSQLKGDDYTDCHAKASKRTLRQIDCNSGNWYWRFQISC